MTKENKRALDSFIDNLGNFHRYDEQLRVKDGDSLIVDLRATLKEPFASVVAAEIEKRWNSHHELLLVAKMAELEISELLDGHRIATSTNETLAALLKAITKAEGESNAHKTCPGCGEPFEDYLGHTTCEDCRRGDAIDREREAEGK